MAQLNFAQIHPWARFTLLALFGSPLFIGNALHPQLHLDHWSKDLLAWSAYAIFIWLVIFLSIGLERLLQWLSAATVLGLTIVVLGVILRKLHIWELLHGLFGTSANATANAGQDELDLIYRLFMIMISLPFALFFINSFPASNLLGKVSVRSPERRHKLRVHAALALRVFQHVFEVATTTLVAWREENPELLLPRFRDDWRGSVFGRLGFLKWVRIAIWTWCLTLTLQTLLIVPIVVRDFKRLLPE